MSVTLWFFFLIQFFLTTKKQKNAVLKKLPCTRGHIHMCSIAVMQSLLSFLIQSAHIKLNQQDYFCVKNNSLRTQERKFILLFFFPPPQIGSHWSATCSLLCKLSTNTGWKMLNLKSKLIKTVSQSRCELWMLQCYVLMLYMWWI